MRQLDRQVSTVFYERTARSKRKAAMLEKGQVPRPEDAVTASDEVRDPYLAHNRTGGRLTTGITVHSGCLNPQLLNGNPGVRVFASATLRDRAW